MTLCTLSTRPFDCGWYDVVRKEEMPNSWCSSAQREDVNCRPWSVVTSAGTPKRAIQCRTKAAAHVEAVMSTKGMASSQRVVLSMTVMRYT